MPRLLLLLLLLMASRCLYGQTVLMPTVGHADTTMSYAEVYDDGGPTGPYSSTCNATYTFHTTTPQGRYIIEAYSNLTHPRGNASLSVYNGTSATGQPIFSFPPEGGHIFHSNTNCVTIKFLADDDYPTDGFQVILCEYNNAVPVNLQDGWIDSNTHYVSWGGGNDTTIWIVEYAVVFNAIDYNSFFDDTNNFTRLLLDTGYLEVGNIPVGGHLVYRIYTVSTTDCQRMTMGETSNWQPEWTCPCAQALNLAYTELGDSVRITWTPSFVPESWHLWCYGLSVDTTLPGNATEITIPYDYPCNGATVNITSACDFLCNNAVLSLPMGGCHQTVPINRLSVTGSTITLGWTNGSDSASRYILYMRRYDQPNWPDVVIDTFPYGVTSCVVDSLLPHTYYMFTMWVICGDGNLACSPSGTIIQTTIDNCIDYIATSGNSNVHFAYGTYNNPGVYPYIMSGRHTPIIDSSLHDQNTGGALRCVPPGGETSFRLGDDDIGAQAEMVTYDYLVDSLDKDMLVLRYAIVMQNPNHTSANQPHFSMEILNAAGQILDTHCCYADFYAAGDLGWNSVPGSNVIWKDWTTVGINIAPYHGQLIKIRFTTKDCADGGHFGYAYYTIHCDSRRIALVNLCETVDSVRLRAPEGFEYQWTHGDNPTVISTDNEIVVPADTTLYHCLASFIGKPDCNFTVNSFAVLPVARAAFRYAVDTCRQKLTLYNESYVDIDSAYRQYVRQTVDSVRWVVDGAQYYGDSVVLDITANKPYNVVIFCKLSGSRCLDSLAMPIDIDIHHSLAIQGGTDFCEGDTVELHALVSPYQDGAFSWNDGSADTVRLFVADADTQLSVVSHYFSCFDTAYHSVRVHSRYFDTLTHTMCPGVFDSLGFHESQTGVYSQNLLTLHGCDSVTTLLLTVYPSYSDTLWAVTCDEPYSDFGFDVDTSGFYVNRFTTVMGCDSVRSLFFLRREVFADTIRQEILRGDVYVGHGFREEEQGFYEMDYVDMHGCDSIYWLDLTVVTLGFPNAVTPNGDGVNDFLGIAGFVESHIFEYSLLMVFDRWGRRLYRAENLRGEADFWHPGSDIPDGTYFYRFVAKTATRVVEYKGVVELIGNTP